MLKLLPENLIIKTNRVDHADWNYKPVLGFVQRQRFRLLLSLIGDNRFDSLLEIGYGSGILMPTLSKYCDHLYGIDTHSCSVEVSDALEKAGVRAKLIQCSASDMPFENDSFDLLVSVSTFEFVKDKVNASKEISRVLKPNGLFIIITPAESWILDFAFRILTNEDPKTDFGNERRNVIPILEQWFDVSRIKMFPPLLGNLLPVYKGIAWVKKV